MICLLVAAACNPEIPALRKGDLLFVGLHFKEYPEEVNYIHTAIIDVDSAGTWIIDATIRHGVARYPLDTFLTDFTLKDGSLPVLEVMRLKDPSEAAGYVDNAKAFIGEKYDVAFADGNGSHYCTELVQDSYVSGDDELFDEYPIDFKGDDGEYPSYWKHIFEEWLKVSIPQGNTGTTPEQMHASENLVHVGFLKPDGTI